MTEEELEQALRRYVYKAQQGRTSRVRKFTIHAWTVCVPGLKWRFHGPRGRVSLGLQILKRFVIVGHDGDNFCREQRTRGDGFVLRSRAANSNLAAFATRDKV